jgi:hypothetical protein
MKISNIFIGALWIYLLIDAYSQGQQIPELVKPIPELDLSMLFVTGLLLILFAISCYFTFWQRHTLMEQLPLVTRLVDRRFGVGTYRNFCYRLRPIGISIASTLVLGLTGIRATHATTGSTVGYLICYIFLTFGAGLVAAYLLSLRYGPALR